MPRINIDLDYFDHYKVDRLEAMLGKGASVLPIRLWIYTGKFHAETGRLTSISASKLEAKINWWGRPGEAVAALQDCGFLEVIDGDYVVHDWLEWQGHIWKYHQKAKAMRAAQLKRRTGVPDPPDPAASAAASRAASRATEVNGSEEIPPQPPKGGGGDFFSSPEGQEAWSDWLAYRGARYSRRDRDHDLAWLMTMGDERVAISSIRATMKADHIQLHDMRGKAALPDTRKDRERRQVAKKQREAEDGELFREENRKWAIWSALSEDHQKEIVARVLAKAPDMATHPNLLRSLCLNEIDVAAATNNH